jgi:hypothetical protein
MTMLARFMHRHCGTSLRAKVKIFGENLRAPRSLTLKSTFCSERRGDPTTSSLSNISFDKILNNDFFWGGGGGELNKAFDFLSTVIHK